MMPVRGGDAQRFQCSASNLRGHNPAAIVSPDEFGGQHAGGAPLR